MTRECICELRIDQPIVVIKINGQIEMWYYADAQGSVRMLTDAGGVIKESYTYDVYGRPRIMRSSGADGNWLTEDVTTYTSSSIIIGNRFMFTGREWDSTTGLYYYRFRDYSPTLGRFLQPDPLGYIDTMNIYAYCGNNPINWIDPWGLEAAELASPLNIPILVDLYGSAAADALTKGAAVAAGVAAGYVAHEVGLFETIGALLTGTVTSDRTAGWDDMSIGAIISQHSLRGSNIGGCPRPPGGPDWNEILKMTWKEIKAAAKAGKKWAKTIKKEMLKKYNWPDGK